MKQFTMNNAVSYVVGSWVVFMILLIILEYCGC